MDAGTAIACTEPEQVQFQHTVLCQTGLPRRRVYSRSFERRSGHMSILLEAGSLFDGMGFVEQPLPYGAIPRLVIVHLSTEAVRTRRRCVEVGESMRQFLTTLGLPTNGGVRGGYTAFRRQMAALAACRLTLGMQEADRAVTVDAKPIKRFEAWLQGNGSQRTLWPGEMELSQEFYDTLAEHAVPLDRRALASLKHSALALDIYTWLAHRLRRVEAARGVKLSWQNLRDQFGQEYRTSKDFKREARRALRLVLAVYPDARVGDVIGGIVLYPSHPPVRSTSVAFASHRPALPSVSKPVDSASCPR